jgi:hypothetical protein
MKANESFIGEPSKRKHQTANKPQSEISYFKNLNEIKEIEMKTHTNFAYITISTGIRN